MAKKETNKKIHVDAINRGDVDPSYGYVYGQWYEVGSHEFKYENAKEPDKFFEQKLTSSGSYKHIAYDKQDKEHIGVLNAGEARNYTQGGWSDQFDGHFDKNGECTGRMEWLYDFGRAIGGDYHDAVNGQRKNITKRGEAKGQAGSSLSVDHDARNSSKTGYVKGDFNHYTEMNHNVWVSGNNHIQYSENEDTRYTGGNYDRYVDKQYHVFSKEAYTANTDSTMTLFSKEAMNASSNADITIKSDTKITLQVGNSTIVIESSKITLNSTEIVIKGTSTVKINGSPVQVNDGTNTTTPFQVT